MGVPDTATRQMISRFSYGYTHSLHKAVAAAGGPQAWFEAQLKPTTFADSTADALTSWFPYLRSSPRSRLAADRAGKRGSWEIGQDLVRWTILRRMSSNRQVLETMVDFWSNLLHVPAYDDGWMYRASYDALIRRYALGSFSNLLVHASLHPSMQVFLNSAGSTKTTVNENHGRELLELHTVGLDGGYTEPMVQASARILTGYQVDTWDTVQQTFSPADHYVGKVRVLGFHSPNSAADGRPVIISYLRYLARHPATAHRLATRLCQRFVSDSPPASIVNAVASAYRSSRSDIKATLTALVRHPEFAASVDAKVRTPAEDAIATYRALGAKPSRPKQSEDFGYAVPYVLGDMGQSPFGWPAPNGFPELGVAWASVGRMRTSWAMHLNSAGGYWPSKGVTRPAARQYLPPPPVRLDAAVDAVSRAVLGRAATKTCVQAVSGLLEMDAGSTITDLDDFGDWRAVLLLSTVLNSPEHLRR